jgi:DNA replication protein DnaC
MSARDPAAIWAEIRALGRPQHPLCGGGGAALLGDRGTGMARLAAWRCALDGWRQANPEGEQRYEALLAELDAGERELAEARRRHAAERSWAEAGAVPQRLVTALESYRADTAAAQAVARWVPSGVTWCVLLGGTGTGKSTAAAWALRAAHLVGVSVAWVQSARLAVDAGGFEGEQLARRLRAVGVLVVDDVGAQDRGQYARDVLRELLTERHEGRARTIVTTNLDGAEFRDHLGERLSERIRHECQATTCRGASMRGGSK